MTILAVEKRCNHIYVASDSRYSIGDIHIDNGTKIFKEKCVICNPLKGFIHMSVGFAFDGNVTFFFNFKNRIEFILHNVLVSAYDDDYDEILLDLIKNCFSDLCLECCDKIDVEGDVLVFFNSLATGSALAYKIMYDPVKDDVVLSMIPNGLTFYGSGANVAQRLNGLNQYVNIVRFMKNVLAYKGNEETIGGNIQIGELSKDGFRVLGYQDYDETSVDFGPHYYFGSSKVPNYENFQPIEGSFLVIYSEEELKEMARKNTMMLTGIDPSVLGSSY